MAELGQVKRKEFLEFIVTSRAASWASEISMPNQSLMPANYEVKGIGSKGLYRASFLVEGENLDLTEMAFRCDQPVWVLSLSGQFSIPKDKYKNSVKGFTRSAVNFFKYASRQQMTNLDFAIFSDGVKLEDEISRFKFYQNPVRHIDGNTSVGNILIDWVSKIKFDGIEPIGDSGARPVVFNGNYYSWRSL